MQCDQKESANGARRAESIGDAFRDWPNFVYENFRFEELRNSG